MNQMMYTGVIGVLSVGLTLGIAAVSTGAQSPLDAFPPAEDDEVRHVIVLAEQGQGEEIHYKVELIPGKLVQTDGVNKVRLGLSLEPVSLKGWGYTYYKVSGKDHVLSTMMAVPEGSELSENYVSGRPLMVRYNSRLPLVIYGPKGVNIRYRIWTAGEEQEAKKGE
ncbi:ecotin family protein [Desulforhopalus sp. 52FAK]